MKRLDLVLVLVLVVACGSDGKPAAPAPSKPVVVAPEPKLAEPPDPHVVEVINATDSEAVRTWIEHGAHDAMPADARAAIAALVDWDRSGKGLPAPCFATLKPQAPAVKTFQLLVLADAVLAQATSADDLNIRALLHAGYALRDPANDILPILIGAEVSAKAARWLVGHKLEATQPFKSYALTDDSALHAARSYFRCTLNAAFEIADDPDLGGADTKSGIETERKVQGLGLPDNWLASEIRDYRAFFEDARTKAAGVTSVADAVKLDAAIQASAKAHPSSILVRETARILFISHLDDKLGKLTDTAREYRAALK